MDERKLMNEILFLDETKLFEPVFEENSNEVKLVKTKYYYKIIKMLNKVGYLLTAENLLKVNKRVYEYTKEQYEKLTNKSYLMTNKCENIDEIIKIVNYKGKHDELMRYASTYTDENILYLKEEYSKSSKDLAQLAIKCHNNSIKYEIVKHIINDMKDIYSTYDILIAEYKNDLITDEILKVISNHNLISTADKLIGKSKEFKKKVEDELMNRLKNKKISIYELESFYVDGLHYSYDKFFEDIIRYYKIDSSELVDYIADRDPQLSVKHLAIIEEKLKNDSTGLVLYAERIKRANLFAIDEQLVKNGNLDSLLYLASNVKFVNMRRLESLVYQTKDIDLIAKLEVVKAKRTNSKIEDKELINKILTRSKNPKIIYMVSGYCAKEYLKQCEESLRKMNSDEYLRYFYKDRRKK